MVNLFRQSKPLGFTLIELLVVISIIGLLGTLAVTALNSARVKARNTKRNTDIVQLIKAFQLAADNAQDQLPYTAGVRCVSTSCYGNWSTVIVDASVDAAIAPYIKKPSDPYESRRSYGGYIYWHNSGELPQLSWVLEPVTNTTNVCGPGYVFFSNQNIIICQVEIN